MNDEREFQLPQAVIERLQQHDRNVTVLTPHIDRAIAHDAQAQFAARTPARRRHVTPAWGLSAAAAAALVFVVVTIREPLVPNESPPGTPPQPALERAAIAGDYDGSGTVDVLDAWRLSRDRAANPRFAANDSVESLMQRIVALDGGTQ